jgi:hypothetical protein
MRGQVNTTALRIYADRMEPGIAELLGPREPKPKIVRVLWRMQGPTRVIVARIERHPFGRELVIAFEDGDDVIETRLERVGVASLEQRAEEVREVLAGKGWTEAHQRYAVPHPHQLHPLGGR